MSMSYSRDSTHALLPSGQAAYPLQGASGHPPPGGPVPGYSSPGQPAAGPPPAFKEGVPVQGPRNDPSTTAPRATAPSLDQMDKLPGYDRIGFDGASLPPPTYKESQREPPQRDNIESVPTITEDQARSALLQFVSEDCCYGKRPAVEMKLNELKSSSAFHYTLETFGEGRSTKWTYEPFNGQHVAMTGPPPGPWDVPARPPQMFHTAKLDIEVPNTASVKPCHACFAMGFQRCTGCQGKGRVECNTCRGSGQEEYEEVGEKKKRACTKCNGDGTKRCSNCDGAGQTQCSECQGKASLRWFILLTIQWTNHAEDHVVEKTALPVELVKGVSGHKVFQETQTRVWPVNHFPEPEINSASNNLVSEHGSKFPTEIILMQRHQVRIIPVTQVFYEYKDHKDSYFVYGFEHRVHAPGYPAKCCCGCSVL
ncbi:protein SSUH2 homolog [Aplysia californica]|uniref:Protein SSUH2 homolog n=1 Tax=Aplysia californica TaxID=6500 RepID=A0ABM0JRN8_APLCA|nr:protein SSUH2 homolog [Aplysia californica]